MIGVVLQPPRVHPGNARHAIKNAKQFPREIADGVHEATGRQIGIGEQVGGQRPDADLQRGERRSPCARADDQQARRQVPIPIVCANGLTTGGWGDRGKISDCHRARGILELGLK